jgi:hypothetical protein
MRIHATLAPLLGVTAALAGGLFIGYVDQHATEEVVTLGIMFLLNLALGAAVPRGAWKWPVLSGAGVPLFAYFPQWAGAYPNPHLPRTLASFALLTAVVMAAAAAGTGQGVMLRRMARGFSGNAPRNVAR